MEDTVRWSLKVSRDTDEALRAHLGRTARRKGDLSKFVQEAVRARLRSAKTTVGNAAPAAHPRMGLGEVLAEIRARTGKLSQARFEKLVAEAVAYARKRRAAAIDALLDLRRRQRPVTDRAVRKARTADRP